MVYEKKDKICPHCDNIMIKYGSVKQNKETRFDFRNQKYQCKVVHCKSFIQTSANKFKDKYSSFTNKIKKQGVKLTNISNLSFKEKQT